MNFLLWIPYTRFFKILSHQINYQFLHFQKPIFKTQNSKHLSKLTQRFGTT
jgi:hypothetical protein